MSRVDTAHEVLRLVVDDGAEPLQLMADRFKAALKRANPDLTDFQMLVYERAYERELPNLAHAVHAAQAEAIVRLMDEDEMTFLGRICAMQETVRLLSLLRRVTPAIAEAAKEAIRVEAVAAHRRCAEAAFAAPDEGPAADHADDPAEFAS